MYKHYLTQFCFAVPLFVLLIIIYLFTYLIFFALLLLLPAVVLVVYGLCRDVCQHQAVIPSR